MFSSWSISGCQHEGIEQDSRNGLQNTTYYTDVGMFTLQLLETERMFYLLRIWNHDIQKSLALRILYKMTYNREGLLLSPVSFSHLFLLEPKLLFLIFHWSSWFKVTCPVPQSSRLSRPRAAGRFRWPWTVALSPGTWWPDFRIFSLFLFSLFFLLFHSFLSVDNCLELWTYYKR